MHRIITDIGFKAFGPFLMPLLWGETCMVDILLKSISYKQMKNKMKCPTGKLESDDH